MAVKQRAAAHSRSDTSACSQKEPTAVAYQKYAIHYRAPRHLTPETAVTSAHRCQPALSPVREGANPHSRINLTPVSCPQSGEVQLPGGGSWYSFFLANLNRHTATATGPSRRCSREEASSPEHREMRGGASLPVGWLLLIKEGGAACAFQAVVKCECASSQLTHACAGRLTRGCSTNGEAGTGMQ